MALAIIHGSLSTIDVSLGAASVKCGFGRMSCQFVRSATRTITFCGGGWVDELPGERQMIGSIIGYTTKGTAWSDPLVWINATAPVAFIGTADTSCTLTGSINVFSDGVDLVAAANSARGVDFRSCALTVGASAAIVSAWVVA